MDNLKNDLTDLAVANDLVAELAADDVNRIADGDHVEALLDIVIFESGDSGDVVPYVGPGVVTFYPIGQCIFGAKDAKIR